MSCKTKGVFIIIGIYVHIPFCERKCAYCDFLSFSGIDKARQEAYVKALIREIKKISSRLAVDEIAVDSVFFGGGTPSVIDPAYITNIMDALRESFRISANAEISIEGNPGSIRPEKLEAWLASGINRLSIGVQSTDDDILGTLGRIHRRDQVFSRFKDARSAGFKNINTDLIFAVPGQREKLWEETLLEIMSQEPEHISFYSLEIEENTPLYQRRLNGEIEIVSEECDRRMYHRARELLRDAGYVHYEISNAAKPGFECRHNLKYWSMEDYLGFGLGSASFFNGSRSSNVRDFNTYLAVNQVEADVTGIALDEFDIVNDRNFEHSGLDIANHRNFEPDGFGIESHKNTEHDNISEFMFLGLRKLEGISISEFKKRFCKDIYSLFAKEISRSVASCLLSVEGDFIRLTARGIDFSNQVFLDFM